MYIKVWGLKHYINITFKMYYANNFKSVVLAFNVNN